MSIEIYIHKGHERWSASIFRMHPYALIATIAHVPNKDMLMESIQCLQVDILQGNIKILDENDQEL